MLNTSDKILFNLDYLAWTLTKALKLSTESYCDLATIDNAHTFVAHDGAVATLIRVDGVLRMIGTAEFNDLTDRLSNNLQAYMEAGHHMLQLVFTRDPDPDPARRLIGSALADAEATMARIGVDLSDLYERKKDVLAGDFCSVENLVLALWTYPQCLTRIEKRQAGDERARVRADTPRGCFAQPLETAARTMLDIHESFVQAVVSDLRDNGILAGRLEAHEALREVKMLIDPAHTDDSWSPGLPGDRIPARIMETGQDNDLSAVLWPPLAEQVFPEGMTIRDAHTITVGTRRYAGLSMHIGPRTLEPFNIFFRRLLNDKIPWLVSFRLISDGYAQVAGKATLASLLSFIRASRIVKRSLDTLKTEMEFGEVFIGLQIQFLTWVEHNDAHDKTELDKRIARLTRAAQGWGGIEPRRNDGNPAAAFASAMPLLRHRSPANITAAPVRHALRMLPLTRPASPWEHGSFLFRTPDSRLYPYEPYSSKQKAWITLIFAPMGSGKSVLMNALNTALVLAAGNERLPRIGILDIGPSSSGLISLIKEALPARRRHEALYVKLKNTRDCAINPMDTLLGCREPLPLQKAFLTNLLTLLATPVGEDKPYEAIPNIAAMAIEEAYQAYADSGTATKRYDAGIDPEVDALLEGMTTLDSQTTWWEVVDHLFEQAHYHGAWLAQRYAAPTLGEVASFARAESIKSIYTGTVPTGTESITDYFWRALTDSINRYEVLGGPTCFSVDARIISLDLDEVAPKGGPEADRQTAIMYMLGRHIITGDIYLRKDHLADIPQKYQDYHRAKIEQEADDPKRLCFDEFHRTEAAESIRKQVLLDIREGRKWKVEVVLASQRLEDFADAMIDLATTVFILGAGTKTLRNTVETFKLPASAGVALENMGSPGRAGANLIAWFDTSHGKFTHLLTNTLAPEEIWAYSTTAEDVEVRNALYERINPALARQALAGKYPGGSVKKEYERRKTLLKEQGNALTEKAGQGLLQEIADEVYQLARGVGA